MILDQKLTLSHPSLIDERKETGVLITLTRKRRGTREVNIVHQSQTLIHRRLRCCVSNMSSLKHLVSYGRPISSTNHHQVSNLLRHRSLFIIRLTHTIKMLVLFKFLFMSSCLVPYLQHQFFFIFIITQPIPTTPIRGSLSLSLLLSPSLPPSN